MIHNFIVNHGQVTDDDVAAMFGDFDGVIDEIDDIIFSDATDLADLAVEVGLFPSKTRARKNGLHGPIPHGLSWIGTKKRRFFVWNPVPPEEGPVFSRNFDHTDKWMKTWDPKWLGSRRDKQN